MLKNQQSALKHSQTRSYRSGRRLSRGRGQTWEYNCVVVFDAELRQVLDVSTGQSGALHQHVSLLLSRSSCQVIYHVHLVDVGCKHVYLQE